MTEMNNIFIIKRSGDKVSYDLEKIENAISKSINETNEKISKDDYDDLLNVIESQIDTDMTVEDVSDIVEIELMKHKLYETAKRYILYRQEKNTLREDDLDNYKFLSKSFLSQYKHKKDPFPSVLGKFVYLRTYSRPLPEKNRREYYWETVARVVDYNISLASWKNKEDAVREAEKLYDNIYNLRQFPSGRAMFSGGTSVSISNPISQYNCSFAVFDNFDILKDIAYLLMLGVGFGFSVEKQYVDVLPKVRGDVRVINKSYKPIEKNLRKEATEYSIVGDIMEVTVGDSKMGWASSLDYLIKVYYSVDFRHVKTVVFNYNNVRPFGEPLKTFGGTASGHDALQTIIEKIVRVLQKDNIAYKKLKPVECMDIANIIAEGIVVGGTRRSAEACLLSYDDIETQQSKMSLYIQDEMGNWNINQDIIHRQMSNNSTAYWKKPSFEELKNRFEIIKHSAENNFFNMESASKRKPNVKGTNPLT